jgi:hypothetical protein
VAAFQQQPGGVQPLQASAAAGAAPAPALWRPRQPYRAYAVPNTTVGGSGGAPNAAAPAFSVVLGARPGVGFAAPSSTMFGGGTAAAAAGDSGGAASSLFASSSGPPVALPDGVR